MSKFNHKAVATAVEEYNDIYGDNRGYKAVRGTTNLAGGSAFSLSPELDLYSRVCTMSLADKYYESENDQMVQLKSLVRRCDPLFVAKLAVYARESMYLRTIPLVLTVELAKHISSEMSNYKDNTLVSRLIGRVIKRADEITEILAYYQKANHRDGQTKKLNKLSNQIKKGIRQVLESGRFDEYQFAKYSRNTEVKLRDALFLTHPKPQDKTQENLFDKIINNSLETPYTWETQLSDAGKTGRSKKEVWEELIDSGRLGYMAMLRNIRNILSESVSREHMKLVCDTLSDEGNVLKSKQLPFRFLSAYRSLVPMKNKYGFAMYDDAVKNAVDVSDSPYLVNVIEALEKAVSYSVQNLPMFIGEDVLISTDVSGSMIHPLNPRSLVTYFDIGALMCMIARAACENSVASMFGNDFKTISVGKKNILNNVQEIYRREGEVGYSTNGYKVLSYALNAKIKFDRIMIFTDCQLYGRNRYGSDIDALWYQYKTECPDAKLYLFNLAGYGTSPIKIEGNDVHLLSGWSDKMFNILSNLDKSHTALDEVNSIEV